MCGGKLFPFLAKLATYHGCVVAANAHIVTRNEPTIGVWRKYMSILTKLVTYSRCVVAMKDLILTRN